jgi:hypothetical protein
MTIKLKVIEEILKVSNKEYDKEKKDIKELKHKVNWLFLWLFWLSIFILGFMTFILVG